MSETVSAIDGRALAALIRQGDGDALDRAYKVTFGNELGRLVLAHHLSECGVGNALGPDNLKYAAGMHDGALSLASKAGFDQAAIAVGVLTDELEERDHAEPESLNYVQLDEDDLRG